MLLLVSVRDVADARAAVAGGADIIDAKDPSRGALGAVSEAVLRAICLSVGTDRPLSAALGDAESPSQGAAMGLAMAGVGLAYGKVGFAGTAAPMSRTAVARVLRAVQSAFESGAGASTRVIAAAYADADQVGAPRPQVVVEGAVEAGAAGVLLDTADKGGPGLFALWGADEVSRWVERVRASGLTAALAGKLTARDLPVALATGADIVGVRSAACEGGRNGVVSVERTRLLVEGARGRIELSAVQ